MSVAPGMALCLSVRKSNREGLIGRFFLYRLHEWLIGVVSCLIADSALQLRSPQFEKLQKDGRNARATQHVLLRISRYICDSDYDASLTFRGYLRRATENAIADFVNQTRRQINAVDFDSVSWMESIQTRDQLADRLRDVFDLELLEFAMSRVESWGTSDRWQACYQTTIQGRENAVVAKELGMGLGTFYAAKNQVRMRSGFRSWLAAEELF